MRLPGQLGKSSSVDAALSDRLGDGGDGGDAGGESTWRIIRRMGIITTLFGDLLVNSKLGVSKPFVYMDKSNSTWVQIKLDYFHMDADMARFKLDYFFKERPATVKLLCTSFKFNQRRLLVLRCDSRSSPRQTRTDMKA
jgi:hypothetical protein